MVKTVMLKGVTGLTDQTGTTNLPATDLTTTTTYDLFGRAYKTTDNMGKTTVTEFDSLGRAIMVTPPDGNIQTTQYVPAQNYSIVTQNGLQQKTKYDDFGRHVSSSVYNPNTSSWTVTSQTFYDAMGRSNKQVSDNTYTITEFYPNGQTRCVFVHEGSETGNVISRTEYSLSEPVNENVMIDGKLHSKLTKSSVSQYSSSSDRVDTVTYSDARGRTVKEETRAYSGGILLSMYYKTYEYDALSRVWKERYSYDDPSLVHATYQYDYAGRVIKQTNILGDSATTVYDGMGRVTSQTDLMGNKVEKSYNALSQVLQEKRYINATTFALSEYKYSKDGQNTITRVQNNAPGQAQTFAVTRNAFDNIGRLVYTVSEGVVAQYQYDIYSRLSDVYTGLSQPVEQPKFSDAAHTQYGYDYAGRKNTETDPLGKSETFVFDDFGRMVSSTDKMGQSTTYQYDGAGRITRTTAGTTITEYFYDYLGNITNTTEGSKYMIYYYGPFRRELVQVFDSQTGVSYYYQYNQSGTKASYTMRKGNAALTSERYEYDNAHRLIKTFVNGETAASVSYTYNKNGAVTNAIKGPLTSTYQYDSWGRQVGVDTYTRDPLLLKVSYRETAQYTLGSNIYHSEMTAGLRYTSVVDYVYDGLGRLVSESDSQGTVKAYTYDNAGNRSHMQVSQNGAGQYQVGYAYDKANQLLSQTTYTGDQTATQTYLYDSNGNMTKKLAYGGGAEEQTRIESQQEYTTQTYVYDRQNRLTSVKQGESVLGSYTYGMGGLRSGKTADQTTVGHVWEGMNMKAQTAQNGSVSELYFYGQTGLIARQIGGQMQYYVLNLHGDVVMMTDSQGNIIRDYTEKPGAAAYDAFGNQKKEAIDDNPFRYCAEYYDQETTFIYLRARYYDPSLGRFITQDPAKADGWNWYTYCTNNPIKYKDPSGLKFIRVFLVAGINTRSINDLWYWVKNEMKYRFESKGYGYTFTEVFPYGPGELAAGTAQSAQVIKDANYKGRVGADHLNWRITQADIASNEEMLIIGHSGGGVAAIGAFQNMDQYYKDRVLQIVTVGSPVQGVFYGSDRVTQIYDKNDKVPIVGDLATWAKFPPQHRFEIDNGYTPIVEAISAHVGYFNSAERAAEILNTFWGRSGVWLW